MLKIALTGNIASGKTTVQKLLETQDFPVLDTDLVCHDLLENSNEIKKAFKDYDVFENGEISRAKLGKLVFSDSELKTKLENLLYPKVIIKIQEFFDTNADKPLVFVAIPQLFEANMNNLFDKIVLIYCEDKIRLKRLIERNNYSQEYAQTRFNAQISQDEKLKLTDFVIYNNKNLTELQRSVNKFIEQIK